MDRLFEFSVLARGLSPEAHDFEDRFVGAGCDDATISFQRGIILLDFARRAPTFEEALLEAVQDVGRAGAKVNGVEPSDLVTLAEIARRAKMTRAAISNYSVGVRGTNFPAPIDRLTTDSPFWSWAEVAAWLHKRDRLSAEEVEAAALIARVNSSLRPAADEDLRKRIAAAA